MSQWIKVECYKCGAKFDGEFKIGTKVFCNKCSLWIIVEKEEPDDGG